ncbi:MAG: hypothetical protein U0359_41205 [Byssovorax sp.]
MKQVIMKKTISVDTLLWAFIENADDVQRSIRVSMAGAPWGYVRIKGPNGRHQVVIERYNASVAVEEIHSTLPGVQARPARADDPTASATKITEHPLGHSSGAQMGKLLWGISAKDLAEKYDSPAAFVSAIVDACEKAGSPW